MLKAIIIGCGRIAGIADREDGAPTTHAAGFLSTPGVGLAACLDTDQAKAASFAKKHGCQVVRTCEAGMERFRPEIVSVCTPDATHFDVVKQILTASYPPQVIFIEKPACRSAYEIEELLCLAGERKIELVVNHTRRFDPHHRELRKRIIGEEFGKLYRAEAVYYSGWQHNGVHVVDTLSFLFNDQLSVAKVSGALPSPYQDDPTLEVELAFERTPGRVVVSGMDESLYQLFDVDLRFYNARLRIEDFGSRIRLERKTINSIGENVLESIDPVLSHNTETPMQVAIGLLVKRLQCGNAMVLDGYRLADVAATMKTIWEGQYVYKNQT